jgi:lipoic acid synthetase
LVTKPAWLKRRIPPTGKSATVVELVKNSHLHTVCEEAHCPNQTECYSRGTATFLLLGPGCTRRCTFCAVDKSAILPPDKKEPKKTADAVSMLGLNFCVLTMVTRDDLPDGGAEHISRTIQTIQKECLNVRVEVLISDLGGNWNALERVLASRPDVLNHNIETIPRLYPQVRPHASYQRSLDLLSRAARYRPRLVVKSGIMLGLGEQVNEVLSVMNDLRKAGCHLLTLGQYLAPSKRHHPVIRYIPPDEFEDYKEEAKNLGFQGVASGPYVRSSYQADQLFYIAKDRFTPTNVQNSISQH